VSALRTSDFVTLLFLTGWIHINLKGHIAADSPILRDQLISLDIMGPLKKLVADPTLPFLETVAEVIGHLCLSKNSYPEVAEAEAIMPALITLLRHESAKPEVHTSN